MRILSLGNFGRGWDGSICDEEHIAKGLERYGHIVERWQREDTPFGSTPVGEYDFVLIQQWDGYAPNLLPELRRLLKCPIVYWAFDYQEDGQEWHERLIGGADIYLSKPFKDSKYPNWQWLPQDFAPDFLAEEHHQRREEEKDIEVLFTGSWVPWESGRERVKVLKAVDEKFDLHIYGVTPDQWKAEGFKNVHGPVMDHGLPALIARAKINLSMDHVLSPGYWSDRNAQIMACGGFVLFRYVPFSETVFRHHIENFYNTEDCLEMIASWLAHPQERLAVAEQGRQYAAGHLLASFRVRDFLVIMRSHLL